MSGPQPARRAAWLLATAAAALLGGCARPPPVTWWARYAPPPRFFYYYAPPQYVPRDTDDTPVAEASPPRHAPRIVNLDPDEKDRPAAAPPAALADYGACVGWWRLCHFF